jgi:hypothetical protein
MTAMRTTLLLLVLSAAACGKDYPQCEKFVDLAFKCDDDLKGAPADEKKTARLMMGSMCEEAFKNDTSSVSGESKKMVTEMYEGIRNRSNCAAKAGTCEQYAKCEDQDD